MRRIFALAFMGVLGTLWVAEPALAGRRCCKPRCCVRVCCVQPAVQACPGGVCPVQTTAHWGYGGPYAGWGQPGVSSYYTAYGPTTTTGYYQPAGAYTASPRFGGPRTEPPRFYRADHKFRSATGF